MTEEVPALRASTFVLARLPWLIGAGALAVYGLTLNHWISIYSLGTVARASGWWWRPELHQPLNFVIFYPFRFLPQTWIPFALNLFNAFCAAVVLVLLARSVALLPHDTPRAEPFVKEPPAQILMTPTSWVPPLVAVTLCGLQLSFWEHATSATGEMIDLLVLAYVIRCLLEFRLEPVQAWLSRAACVYGVGMANNWTMVAFLPVFVAAILRLKGYGPFLEGKFLLRMAGRGSLGLGLYFLLPLVCGLSSQWEVGFSSALKAHLKFQKEALGYLQRPAFGILAATSVLPILVLSIRWKSHSVQLGDDTRLGVFITKATVHVVHAFFFLSAIWLALDPTFGPRQLAQGTPLLGYYYLYALVFGYCTGHFLLFGSSLPYEARGTNARRQSDWLRRTIHSRAPHLAASAGVLLACALPLILAAKNLPEILTTNGRWLRMLARHFYSDLPVGKSVVLSDSTAELLLLQAELSAYRNDKQPILLEMSALATPQYQRFTARKISERWPLTPVTNQVGAWSPEKVLDLISSFAAREPLIQLQWNPGILLEFFDAQPSGCVYYLRRRKPDDSVQPRRDKTNENVETSDSGATASIDQLPANQFVDEGERAWQQRWTEFLEKLTEYTKGDPRHSLGFGTALRAGLRLAPESNLTSTFVGAAYSKRLNCWGVKMQRLGHAREAQEWFGRARALNPENLTARINLEYAERCRHGDRARLDVASFENENSELFARHSDWRAVLSAYGPVDEPSFLFRTGRVLLAAGSPSQATSAFARAAELAPDWAAAKLWQAQCCLLMHNFQAALQVTDRVEPPNLPPDGAGLARLLDCRATALNGLGRTNEAARCLEGFVEQYAKYDEVLLVASEIHARNQQFEAGLALVEELLKRAPNRPDLLARKGLIQLQLSKYEAATMTLTTALSLVPRNDEVRLYRAVAYLGVGQLEAARADYQELLKTSTQRGHALFGLGTIAWQQKDTNAAFSYYQQYLSNGIPGSGQYAVALERLKELNSTRAN
jgi:tetratricopeptide (TPR) repeat protein